MVYWGENRRDRKKMKKVEWKNNECDKWGDKERERVRKIRGGSEMEEKVDVWVVFHYHWW